MKPLSDTTLKMLNERICRLINYLATTVNSSTPLWDEPIKMCERIEKDLFEVDSVINESRRYNNHFNGSTSPIVYQAVVTRVYILVYYRHRDEQLYKEIVFPRLRKNMGVYCERHLKTINDAIDEILLQEDMVEKYTKELKKNSKPKYSLIRLSSGEADEYFSEFSNEKLFRDVCRNLENFKEHYYSSFDVASIWMTAKDVVQKLWQEKSPEIFIDRIYHKLSLTGGTGYVESGAAEAVLLCAYMMMRSVNESDYFHKAIAYIERIPNKQNDYHLLYDEIGYIKRLFDDGSITFDDYDYTGGVLHIAETYTKADVEQMLQDKNDQIEQLKIAAGKVTVLEQEKEQLKTEKTQLYTKNQQLLTEVEALKNNKDEYSQKGIPANQAAVLVQMMCHNLGGLPNNTKSLSPIMSELWGFSGSTADRALGEKLKPESAKKLATIFKDVSPKIERLLNDFPKEYDNLRKEKLRNNNRLS